MSEHASASDQYVTLAELTALSAASGADLDAIGARIVTLAREADDADLRLAAIDALRQHHPQHQGPLPGLRLPRRPPHQLCMRGDRRLLGHRLWPLVRQGVARIRRLVRAPGRVEWWLHARRPRRDG